MQEEDIAWGGVNPSGQQRLSKGPLAYDGQRERERASPSDLIIKGATLAHVNHRQYLPTLQDAKVDIVSKGEHASASICDVELAVRGLDLVSQPCCQPCVSQYLLTLLPRFLFH